jgi:hypothetical protein
MHDDLDTLIDGALAAYSTAEPLAGLDQRVLERVRVAEAARRRRWRWGFVLAAPALGATVLMILAPRPEAQPVRVAIVQPKPAPVALPTLPPASPRPVVKARRPAPKPELPKRNLFPTVSPLTDEERLLVGLAQSNPGFLPPKPVEEIEIKPIEIAPLQVDGGQQGESKQ